MQIASAIVMWIVVLVLGNLAWRRDGDEIRRALKIATGYFRTLLPRMVMALLMAGFVAELIPEELIGTWIGGESGIQGILIASGAGIFVPAGALVIMPIAVALLKVGVGLPQLVAFVSSWAIFAVHRMVTYEAPMMGGRFIALRLLASCPIPFLAGISAGYLIALVPG